MHGTFQEATNLAALAHEVLSRLQAPRDQAEEDSAAAVGRRQLSAAVDLVDQATAVIRLGDDRLKRLEDAARRTQEENKELFRRILDGIEAAQRNTNLLRGDLKEAEARLNQIAARAEESEARASAAEARALAVEAWHDRLKEVLREWAVAPVFPRLHGSPASD